MIDKAELVVIGAGPAGMEAAINAANAGVKVVMIDAYPQPGGQYYKQLPVTFSSEDHTQWRFEADSELRQLDRQNISIYSNTIVWGIFKEDGELKWCLALYGSSCPQRIYTKSIILATGAYDRAIPFPGWTLAGVMTAGAVQTMIKHQRVLPGKNFLLSGTGPLQLAVAAELIRAGAQVNGFLEGAQQLWWKGIPHLVAVLGHLDKLREGYDYWRTLSSAGVPIQIGWSVVEARGDKEVEEAVIARLDSDWKPIPGTEKIISADTLVTGYNLLPSNELSRMIECEHVYNHFLGGYVPRRDEDMQTSISGVYAAGDGAGIGGVEQSKLEGQIAGIAAAIHLGKMNRSTLAQTRKIAMQKLNHERRFSKMLGELFTPGPGLFTLARDDTIICRCENVTLAKIEEIISWDVKSIQDLKNITRITMGYCQGRVCSDIAAHILAAKSGIPIDGTGILKVRPPIHPIPIAYLEQTET